ncbi:hypothetical protein MATL_G00131690 [Megalops atlanticus]|uniref:Uncharacterized protein n=1 Tax=Megalops atlanticus TaxID=7932 RepID=A0A9D3PXV0_MEGAT|nr:hypothetical protein MATL_G00131690 [Megalops atlanticus]
MVTSDSTYQSERAILKSDAGYVQSCSILGEIMKPIRTREDGAWGALTEKKAVDTQQSSATTQSLACSTF